MSFGSKTAGHFSFDDAAKQLSSVGKWRDAVFKLSNSANNWDELWDAKGNVSLIEMLLYGINVPEKSRIVWVGQDRNCDFSLVSLALTEIAGWTGGDVPSATNPVVIMVKPGEYEDYMEFTQNYVHVFGVGNQAESVIIQNNAHHILTVNHPTAGVAFNIIKGLELYQYGNDAISNVLFNTTANPNLTALMCRECFFKRDVNGATTVNSDAMFKVNHGLFFGEDIRVEMAITASAATARNPHMFYMGNGAMAGLILRDAKIDYSSYDIDDVNALIKLHASFTGEVNIEQSEINILADDDSSRSSTAVFYLLDGQADVTSYVRHSSISMESSGWRQGPATMHAYNMVTGKIVSTHNDYFFDNSRGVAIFGGSAGAAESNFDSLRGLEALWYTGITDIKGMIFDTELGLAKTPRIMMTPEGGLAIRMTNKTLTTSVKGSIVQIYNSTAIDNAVDLSGANSIHPIGIMYDGGVADGDECWVVVSGRAQVLLKDGQAGVKEYWLGTSGTVGRANCKTDPASQSEHMQEIGHCMEAIASGTDVLAYAVLHFN